jgi:hypothetical protein
MHARGELSDEEATALEDELVDRMLASHNRPDTWGG